MGQKPPPKKELPILLIAVMGVLVFLVLFFLFEKKPTESVSPVASDSSELQDPGAFRSEVTPGEMRIDSEKEASPPQTEAKKKPIGPLPKKELTFLKTLKEGKKKSAPLKIMKKPEKVQKTTTKTKLPKTKQTTIPSATLKPSENRYAVQVASFPTKNNAEVLAEKLRKKGYEAYVVSQQIPQRGRWYRVRVGHYADRAEAVSISRQIKRSEKFKPFVTSDHQ